MKQFKISDAVKKWMCEGCEDRINDNCWKNVEYYSKRIGIFKDVCKECYDNHWVNLLHRPISICTIDDF